MKYPFLQPIRLCILFYLSSCGYRNYNYQISEVKSKAYQKGLEAGKKHNDQKLSYNEAFRIGFHQHKDSAFIKGHKLGIKDGEHKTVVEAISIIKGQNTNKLGFDAFIQGQGFIWGSYKIQKSINGKKSIIEQKALESYRLGQLVCQDSSLYLMKGQSIQIDTTHIYKPKINYDTLVQKLVNAYPNIQISVFDEVIWSIHSELLSYLSQKLLLNDKEIGELEARYNSLHNKLTKQYYNLYYENYIKESENYPSIFYDYQYFRVIDVFTKIVVSNLCPLTDVLLTFVKSNSQYAALTRFNTFRNICELLLNDLLPGIESNLRKVSLYYEYNKNISSIESSSKEILSRLILGHKKDYKKVQKKIKGEQYRGKNYEATVIMKIETVYDLQLDMKDFWVDVDHINNSFTINLSHSAKVFNIIHQSYQVKKIINRFDYETQKKKSVYNFSPRHIFRELIFERKGKKKRRDPTYGTMIASLDKKDFEGIFNQFKPTSNELAAKYPELSPNDIDILKLVIKKIIEPTLNLPIGCYRAFLRFKNRKYKLYKSKCD